MSTELQVLQESQGFTFDQQTMLKERLKEHDIKERPGAGGKKLKYVSGDYAIATANRIFGYGKWGYRVLSKSREIAGEKEFYTADIELYVIGCPFPFPGEGVGVPQNATIEQHEKARKEAVTDALKRALRHFGDQFGLSLYNEDNYIEAEDGSEKRVGDVGKATNGQRPQTAPRVVDATPPLRNGDGTPAMPAQDEQSDVLKQMLDKCKRRAFDVGIKTKSEWIAFRKQYGHAESDGQVTISGVGAMNGELTIREKAAKSSGNQ